MSTLSQMANKNKNNNGIKQLLAIIETKKEQITNTLQSEVKFNKFKSNLIRLYSDTTLKSCTPLSVLGAAMQVANLQLDLDPTLGQAYVLSRWDSKSRTNVASFQIGYQGLLELTRRSGEIKRIETHIIWENEQYEYFFDDEKGTVIKHYPLPPSKRGESRIAAYFVGYLTNGSIHKEWMWGEEIEILKKDSLDKIKPQYQKYSPWMASSVSEDAMWKKTTIRRGVKYLPKTSEIETVFSFEDEEAKGNIVDYSNVVEGQLPEVKSTSSIEQPKTYNEKQIPKPIYTPQQESMSTPQQKRPMSTPRQESISTPQQESISTPQQKRPMSTPRQESMSKSQQEPDNEQSLFDTFDPFADANEDFSEIEPNLF